MTKHLFLILALLCAATLAWADNYNVGTDGDLRAAIQNNNANITVTADIGLSNSTLSIPSNATVTINLNGHTLDRKLTQRGQGGGQVITVRSGATLNLSNGTLKGGWGGDSGGINNEGGTANLTNVTITGCTGDDRGGGIVNRAGSTLNMTGGSITNNVSRDNTGIPAGGGGIFNYEGATATLTNVTITGNETKVYGGGGIDNFGTLTLNGCTITGNTSKANGAGIWTSASSTLNMLGEMTVADNAASESVASNLFLSNGAVITVTGSLAGSNISLSMEDVTGTFTSGYSTYNSGTDPATVFSSVVPGVMAVSLDANNEAQLTNTLPEGTVYYIDRSWDEVNHVVTSEVKTLASGSYTTMPDSHTNITIQPGYYVVSSNVEVDDIILDGDGEHHFILCDGAEVKADIVNVAPGKTLHVYGQAGGSGRLYIPYGNDDEGEREAAIGGRINQSCGTVIIHGGRVYAEGRFGSAGIGGGMGGNGGTVTIYGGTVYALGGGSSDGCGAGIGGGYIGAGGTVTIYGGEVTTETNWDGAGIGTGSNDRGKQGSGPFAPGRQRTDSLHHDDTPPVSGGTVTIWGGYVQASAFKAAGIGGGGMGNGADVTINGGIVKATGGENGAGIGTGENKNYTISHTGTLIVNGGEVYAIGGDDAAGIGGGYDASGSNVTVNGGYVYAKGNGNGAGIGSGCESIYSGGLHGGRFIMTGGHVEAYGGTDAAGIGGGEDADGAHVEISGGYVLAQGNDWGAGIGGGQGGDGGNVTITGGTVIAKAGRNETECRAIGPGEGDDVYGSLTLGDNLMVSSERRASAAERHDMCWYRTQVRIEPCDHQDATYTVSGTTADDTHTRQCPYCLDHTTECHTFDHGTCTVCGVQATAYDVKLYLPLQQNDGSYDGETYLRDTTMMVVPESAFILPVCATDVPGFEFRGWTAITDVTGDTLTSSYTTTGETLLDVGDRDTIHGNVSYVPRYQVLDITLYDDAPNLFSLLEYKGLTAHSVTFSGHTLYKDDDWNTLCLPFALSADSIAAGPLAGCTLMELDTEGTYETNKHTGYVDSTQTLNLFFKAATAIEAGKPYLIKWASGTDITNPVFTSVTIDNTMHGVRSSDGTVIFAATYNPIEHAAERKDVLFLGANNTFYWPDGVATTTVPAFHGYFALRGIEAGDPAAAAPGLRIVSNLTEENDATDVRTKNEEVRAEKFIKEGILYIRRNGVTYDAMGKIIRER